MSPNRPRVVTRTLVTTRKPRIIHKRKKLLPALSGSMPIPRKMLGRAISVMEASMVAMSMPRVEMKRATHLYPGEGSGVGAATRGPVMVLMSGTERLLLAEQLRQMREDRYGAVEATLIGRREL